MKNRAGVYDLGEAEKELMRLSSCQVEDHPAVQAWRKCSRDHALPRAIETLVEKRTGESFVYRLVGVGVSETDVIAKRCKTNNALAERTVYEKILPDIPVTSLRFYGNLDAPEGNSSWVFVEDAGGRRYTPDVAEESACAAAWLGLVHVFSEKHPATAGLRDRGPEFFYSYLRPTRKLILECRGNLALRADEHKTLENIAVQCEFLESRWPILEEYCFGIPRTLVHNDFLAQNVAVRTNSNGLFILPYDWGSSGRGVPMTDLESIHLPTYLSTVQRYWPDLTADRLERLAGVGKIFWCIARLYNRIRYLYDFRRPDWIMHTIAKSKLDLQDVVREWSSRGWF